MVTLRLGLALGVLTAVSNAMLGPSSRCKDAQHACLSTFVECSENCYMPGTRGLAAVDGIYSSEQIPVLTFDVYTLEWEKANPKYHTLVTVQPDPANAALKKWEIEPIYINADPGVSSIHLVLSQTVDGIEPQFWRLVGLAGSRLIITIGQPDDPASATLPVRNVTDTSLPFALANVNVQSTTYEDDVSRATHECNVWWNEHVNTGLKIGLGVGVPIWTILVLVIGTLFGKHLQKQDALLAKGATNVHATTEEDIELASDEERTSPTQKP